MEISQAIKNLQLKFTSDSDKNDYGILRATILREEFDAIMPVLEKWNARDDGAVRVEQIGEAAELFAINFVYDKTKWPTDGVLHRDLVHLLMKFAGYISSLPPAPEGE